MTTEPVPIAVRAQRHLKRIVEALSLDGGRKTYGMLHLVSRILHPLRRQRATHLLSILHGQVSAGSSTPTICQHPRDYSKGAPSARL
jgi:hypothetical protein